MLEEGCRRLDRGRAHGESSPGGYQPWEVGTAGLEGWKGKGERRGMGWTTFVREQCRLGDQEDEPS